MHWFHRNWPWLGLGIAGVLAVLLFSTNLLRGDRPVRRTRDVVWLAWLAWLVYLLHETEEYGIDFFGVHFAFPAAMCATLGLPAPPACPIPPAFFTAVNTGGVWGLGLLGVFWARRRPVVGLALYGVIFVNAILHILPLLRGQGYQPGLCTALVLFLPVSVWIFWTNLQQGVLRRMDVVLIVLAGVLVHVVLLGSVLAFLRSAIGARTLVAIQVLNAAVPWAVISAGQGTAGWLVPRQTR